MIKRVIFTVIMIFSTIFYFSPEGVFATDIDSIKSEQAQLSFLKESDPISLVAFSEYDLYYDMNLFYNPEVRKLIEDLTTAEEHCKQSNVSVSYYEYRKILRTMPPSDFFYMLMAYRLCQTGFFSLAHEAMNKVEDKEIWEYHIKSIRKYGFPKVSLKTQEEVFFAELLADIVYNNLTEESLTKLAKAEKILSNSDYASYIRAKAYFADKKYRRALNEINKAISKNQENVSYLKFKAEILATMKKSNEALSVLKQINTNEIIFIGTIKNIDKIKYYILADITKNELEKKYYLAYYFYLNKDYQRAINELNNLILKGDSKNAPKLLGYIYKITDRKEDAKKLYEKCLGKNPKNAFAYKGLGDIFLSEKMYTEALANYQKAIKYDKNDIETLIALSVTYNKLDDKKNAVKYLDKASNKNQNNFKVLYLSTKLKQDVGKQYLKSSIRYNPFYPEGWLDMAESAIESNDFETAEKYVNTAAFITKQSPRYFYLKSIVNVHKDHLSTAEIDVNRAKELSKKQGLIRENKNNEQI